MSQSYPYYFCSLAALFFKDAMNIVNREYSYQTVLQAHTLSADQHLYLGEVPSTTVWLSSYLLGHHWFPIQSLFDFDPQKLKQDCGSWLGKLTTACIAKVLVSCPSIYKVTVTSLTSCLFSILSYCKYFPYLCLLWCICKFGTVLKSHYSPNFVVPTYFFLLPLLIFCKYLLSGDSLCCQCLFLLS